MIFRSNGPRSIKDGVQIRDKVYYDYDAKHDVPNMDSLTIRISYPSLFSLWSADQFVFLEGEPWHILQYVFSKSVIIHAERIDPMDWVSLRLLEKIEDEEKRGKCLEIDRIEFEPRQQGSELTYPYPCITKLGKKSRLYSVGSAGDVDIFSCDYIPELEYKYWRPFEIEYGGFFYKIKEWVRCRDDFNKVDIVGERTEALEDLMYCKVDEFWVRVRVESTIPSLHREYDIRLAVNGLAFDDLSCCTEIYYMGGFHKIAVWETRGGKLHVYAKRK